jgi:hypothetical protein
MVIVVPLGGGSEGDAVESFEHPPVRISAVTLHPTAIVAQVDDRIPFIRPGHASKVKKTFA